MNSLGLTIARLRDRRGLSQAELGRLAGINQTAVSKIENGKRMPGTELLVALANALKTTPDRLLRTSGLIENDPPEVQDCLDVLRRLGPEERRDVLRYAHWRLAEQSRAEQSRAEQS